MDEAFIYLIKVNIALVVFYLFYRLYLVRIPSLSSGDFVYGQYWVYHLFILWLHFHSKKNKRWLFNKRLFNTHPIYFQK